MPNYPSLQKAYGRSLFYPLGVSKSLRFALTFFFFKLLSLNVRFKSGENSIFVKHIIVFDLYSRGESQLNVVREFPLLISFFFFFFFKFQTDSFRYTLQSPSDDPSRQSLLAYYVDQFNFPSGIAFLSSHVSFFPVTIPIT